MSDQWDEKARELAWTGVHELELLGDLKRREAGILAALRAAYDKGVEDSERIVQAGRSNEWGDDLRSIASRIRALKGRPE